MRGLVFAVWIKVYLLPRAKFCRCNYPIIIINMQEFHYYIMIIIANITRNPPLLITVALSQIYTVIQERAKNWTD